jgi:putative spermidine/putrescine transport system permease protein
VPTAATLLAGVLLVAVALYMVLPLLVVAAASLTGGEFLVFPPSTLSVRWYAEVLRSGKYLGPAWTSLQLASLVTVLALAVGAPAAYVLARRRFPGRRLLEAAFLSPLILPTIVLGIALLVAFSRYAGGPSFWALAAGHVVITLPYVIRTLGAVLAVVDPAHEEAARTMGAGWWARYRYVVLPQCREGLVASAFFAFIISFDDAVVALFLRAPGVETLPLRIYSELEFSTSPAVAAVSTLVVGATVGLILAGERLLGLRRLLPLDGDRSR